MFRLLFQYLEMTLKIKELCWTTERDYFIWEFYARWFDLYESCDGNKRCSYVVALTPFKKAYIFLYEYYDELCD